MAQVDPFAPGFLPNTLTLPAFRNLMHHPPMEVAALILANLAALGGGGGGAAQAKGAVVSRSGTCTGISQTIAEIKTDRGFFSFQNPSGNSGTMWVDPLGGAAAANSPRIEVKPGQGFKWDSGFIPTNKITVIGTNGEKWTAYEG